MEDETIDSEVWASIGILFDIDQLGENEAQRMYYGRQARLIFMKHFDPGAMGRGWLWHGDTQKTLDGDERRWCIAVTAADPAGLQAVRAAFSRAADRGLAPLAERFCEHPVDIAWRGDKPEPVRREPLPLWLAVHDDGAIFLVKPVLEDLCLCQDAGKKFRLPDELQARVLRIQSGAEPLESAAGEGSDDDSCAFAAVDIEAPGAPRSLLKYLDHFDKKGPEWALPMSSRPLGRIIDWPAEKIVSRPDRRELEAILSRLGGFFLEKEVFGGAAEAFAKLAACLDAGSDAQWDALAFQALALASKGESAAAMALAQKVLAQRPRHATASKALSLV